MPTHWGHFGKKTQDLFSRKYNFKSDVKVITKTQDGYKIETALSGKLVGAMRVTAKKDFGKVQARVQSDPAGSDCLKVKLKQLAKDVVVVLDAESNGTYGGKVTFARGAVTGTAKGHLSEGKTTAGASASFAIADQVVVGGAANVEFQGGQEKVDWNMGVEARHEDLTATLKTQNERKDVTLSVFHKLRSDLLWGFQFLVHPFQSGYPDLTLGLQHNLSEALLVKARGDTTGLLQLALEHRVRYPDVKLNVAMEFDVKSAPKPQAKQFGFSLTFGDYR